jgi:hypothetical protein
MSMRWLPRKVWLIVILLGLAAACARPPFSTRPIIPPGQAKKVSGSKSAKPHAPGQQKQQTPH